MYRFILPFVVFVLLIVVFSFGLFNDPRKLPSPFIDEQAPTFELPSLTRPGETVGTDDFGDGFALLNVWANWCVGCRQEHDFLLQLANSGTIPIYGINWRDDRNEAIRWLQQLGDPYVVSGYDGTNRAGIDWGVYAAPETFLVDPDGIIRHKHLGPLSAAIWERDFVPLIRREAGS